LVVWWVTLAYLKIQNTIEKLAIGSVGFFIFFPTNIYAPGQWKNIDAKLRDL